MGLANQYQGRERAIASEPRETERAGEAARERACWGVRGAKPLGLRLDAARRFRAEHAHLHQQPGEVEDAALVDDQRSFEAEEEPAGDVDPAPGRGHSEEVAGVLSRDAAEQRDTISLDDEVLDGQREVGEGRKPEAIDALDVGAPLEDTAGRADDDAFGGVV